MSEETKKKISISAMGNKRCVGRIMSAETRKKIGEANAPKLKGRIYSLEHRRRISEGRRKWWAAHPEVKILFSENRKGDKGQNWQGGKTSAALMDRRGIKYREWRSAVFTRDNFSCVECGMAGGWNKELGKRIVLNADHIKLYSQYPELRYEIDNGRTLCLDCHRKTPSWGGTTKFKKQYANARNI